MALDSYTKNPENYKYNDNWLKEIKKASYRNFTKGFYFGRPGEEAQNYDTSGYTREYDFIAMVLDYDEKSQIATLEQRNRIFVGDVVEVFGPNKDFFSQTIDKMWNEKDEEIEVAPHAQEIIKIKTKNPVNKFDLLRKSKGE